jgi:putative peptide maturation system protein
VSDKIPLDAALDYLVRLATDNASPDDAIERIKVLRAEHAGIDWEVVWAEQVFGARFDYDLLIGHPTLGTVSLGLTARDGVPFPLRGVQRWAEMEVVRVNHRSLSLYEAAPMLDPYWGEARIYQRIVDFCIVRRELEVHDLPVADDELQRGIDEFRRRRGLDTPDATERWLTEHGLTLDRLEAWIEHDLRTAALRHHLVGATAEAAFRQDPSAFDELRCAAFFSSDADAWVSEIRRGTSFFEVAERALAGRRDDERSARSILFETLRRADVEASEALTVGVFAAQLHGAGPYVTSIHSISPAAWADARTEIEERLFATWLAGQRQKATIEWNWGAGRPKPSGEP